MSNYQRPVTRSAHPQNRADAEQEYGYYDQPVRRQGNGGGRRKRTPLWTIPVMTVCVLLIAVFGWWVQQQHTNYRKYLAVREQVNQSTFYPGTVVDGVDLGGKTLDEAKTLIQQQLAKQSEQFAITIQYGDKNWRITSQELPVGADSDYILRRAYAIGRGGSLQQRYGQVLSLAKHGLQLSADWGYDQAQVRALVDMVAERVDQPPVDAKLTAFNPNTKEFVFVPEQDGMMLDRDRLYNDVVAALDAKNYTASVTVQTTPVSAAIRKDQIGSLFGLVSSFTTETTDDRNRNNNINLAAQAINGKMIMPGEKLSFNTSTGQRTQAKGYLEAGAIQGGQLVDETGGGVCQASSTLFNAVVRADLEIVTRSQHMWPSTYVNRGEDAAVDYPRLDFVFRNNQKTPVFVIAFYADRKITVQIYGKLMPPGYSINLFSETVRTTKASDEVIYTRNESLAPESSKVAKKKRDGYIVDTYKVYYQDGVEVDRKKLWRTEYRPVQQEVYFN